jgi:hypothetical protein
MPDKYTGVRLNCFYYAKFVVLELDDPGIKGSGLIAVRRSSSRSTNECKVENKPISDMSFDSGNYFVGAKGPFLFLQDSDGLNGGVAFTIVDVRSGKKVFEDTAKTRLRIWKPAITFSKGKNGNLTLHYLRVAVTDCSIPIGGANCWKRLEGKYGLKSIRIPSCAGYLRKGQRPGMPGTDDALLEERKVESAIAYPVRVTLSLQPQIIPIPGRVSCNASE